MRFAAGAGVAVIGVEPVTAASATASLAAGEPTAVATPGTTMAGLDCSEVSEAAWPSLRDGLLGTITVTDADVHQAMRELAAAGLALGDCSAATVAALRTLATAPEAAALREAAEFGLARRVAGDRHGGRDGPRQLRRGDQAVSCSETSHSRLRASRSNAIGSGSSSRKPLK